MGAGQCQRQLARRTTDQCLSHSIDTAALTHALPPPLTHIRDARLTPSILLQGQTRVRLTCGQPADPRRGRAGSDERRQYRPRLVAPKDINSRITLASSSASSLPFPTSPTTTSIYSSFTPNYF
ncbi:hypothetical protein O3P69_003875 [Scylla paramamosain]|uniref:Uncharacterized protein n=1 Tax=Scylla paramamosain TaxID=85552 RepID=A0AAW0UDR1_SCYPA